MDSKKSNICVLCEHARDRVDVAGVYCVGGFWKKPDGTCDHYKEYQAGTALTGKMDREELVKALRCCTSGPSVYRCKSECVFYKGGDMGKCIPEMGSAAADMLENDMTHVASLQAEITALRSQVEQLTNGQAPRWIPVEERLPETDAPVLHTALGTAPMGCGAAKCQMAEAVRFWRGCRCRRHRRRR